MENKNYFIVGVGIFGVMTKKNEIDFATLFYKIYEDGVYN